MDQYEGSYVVRLLLLCLSPSHLTFLLFLISFFRPDPPFLCFILLTLCFSPSLLIRLSLLHSPLPFFSIFLYLSQSLSSRTRCAQRRKRMTMLVDRLSTVIFRLFPEFPTPFGGRERSVAAAAAIPKCENNIACCEAALWHRIYVRLRRTMSMMPKLREINEQQIRKRLATRLV